MAACADVADQTVLELGLGREIVKQLGGAVEHPAEDLVVVVSGAGHKLKSTLELDDVGRRREGVRQLFIEQPRGADDQSAGLVRGMTLEKRRRLAERGVALRRHQWA